jgi:glyoxylase I family protein
MADNTKLELHLKALEEKLLSEDVRHNPQKLDAYIADGFLEIGASGNVWSKQTVIKALKDEPYSEISISEFKVILLTKDVALVTYNAYRKPTKNNPEANSLRSSIWKLFGKEWKIIFHQGTVLK